MNVFGTVHQQTSWSEVRGVVRRHEHLHHIDFLDISVDSTLMRAVVEVRSEPPRPVKEMTWLSEAWPDEAIGQLRRLLGEDVGDFDDGRLALLVCNKCGDLGCGALSASLLVTDDSVEWQDVGWQTDYAPFNPAQGGFTPPMTFRFDRVEYEGALRTLLAHFEELSARKPTVVAAPSERSRTRFSRRH